MKLLLRLAAFALGVAAFILLIVDGTTSIAGHSLILTSVSDVLTRLDPGLLGRWQKTISTVLHPTVWNVLQASVLAAPAMIVAGVAAILLMLLGRSGEPEFQLKPRAPR